MSPWLSGWQYRKSHKIIGSSAGAQTDYQIKIIVYYSGLVFNSVWDSGVIASGTTLDTARNIVIDGNYLYAVSNKARKLVIYDISNPSAPVLKSTTSLSYEAVDVRKKGNYLFVSCANGVQVWNVSNVESPTLVTTIFNDGYYVHGMFLSGNYLYCCRHTLNKFVIVDVSNPESPVVKGSLTGTTYFHGAHDVYVDDANNLAYVTNYLADTGEYGLTVVNISDKNSPSVVTGVGVGHKNSHIIKMGNYLYVGTHEPDTGLTVWDISSPSSPSYVGRFFTNEGASVGYWMAIYDSTRFVAICPSSNKLYLIDVSNPSSPVITAYILVGLSSNPANVAVAGEYIYVSWTHETTYDWHITSYTLATMSDSGERVVLNGKCRADFGDIRFTSSDGVTELSYWIEEKTDYVSAIIWVKVPSIPASPNETEIYIYYGKSDATTTSNGDNTFVFFDDFSGNTLDTIKWPTSGGGGSISVSGGFLTLTNPKYIVSANAYAGGYAFRARVKCGTSTSGISWCGFVTTAGALSNKDMTLAWYYNTSATYFKFNSGNGTSYQIIDSGVARETANFHVVEARRTGTVDKFQIDSDTEKTGIYPTNLTRYLTFHAYSADIVVDWIIIRKYVYPEPSHGTWGSEETPAPIETIVSNSFPMNYISKPIKAQILISKVEGATVTKVAKDYPEVLIKKDKAQELKSKFS